MGAKILVFFFLVADMRCIMFSLEWLVPPSDYKTRLFLVSFMPGITVEIAVSLIWREPALPMRL